MREISCLLIRHGKTIGNINKRYIGCKTDEELCEKGIEELSSIKFTDCSTKIYDKVFVSPLIRCIQSADIIFPNHEKIIVEDFREIDFGDFENKNYQELQNNSDYLKWIELNGRMQFPNGESRETFINRNIRAFKNVLLQELNSYKNEMIPFIIHGGSIMAIMSELTGEEYYDFQIPCGDAYNLKCVMREEKIDAVSYNCISLRGDS